MDQVVSTVTSLVGHLSQADLLVIAAAAATYLQAVAKKYHTFQEVENWLISLSLPWLTVLIPYAESHQANFGVYGGLVYFLSQVLYLVVKRIKASGTVQVPSTVQQAENY